MQLEAREAAYVEFVTARQTHLRRIAYAVCGDWRRADEILRHALTRLYVAWPRQQREGTEEAFVRRLILRADGDGHRGHDARPAPEWTPLFAALQSLPAKQRRVVLLRHWLGLSAEETAEDLGMTVGTVEAHDARALAALPIATARENR